MRKEMITRFRVCGVCLSVFAALCFSSTVPVLAAPMMAAGQAARLTEPSGGFSYVPPAGWHIRSFPGSKYKVSFVKAAGFAPNINVVDETAAVPMGQYVKMSFAQMKQTYTDYRMLSQAPFVTRAGLQGVRIVSEGTVVGRHVHQIFYIFPARNNRKIILTASWLASDGTKYTQATDGAMKTFKLL